MNTIVDISHATWLSFVLGSMSRLRYERVSKIENFGEGWHDINMFAATLSAN
jgi:hypothetical protein